MKRLLTRIMAVVWMGQTQPSRTAADEVECVLNQIESRIRAIYERREFRAVEVSADWLPDSSAYRILERDPKTNELVERIYEVRAGFESPAT